MVLAALVALAVYLLWFGDREAFGDSAPPAPALHYVTVATKPHPVLDALVRTVEAKGERLHVLGMQEEREIGWGANGAFGVKLREVHDFLASPSLGPDDVVLFSDAYDVFYCGDATEVLRRFAEFSTPVVFGAEVYCWPDPDKSREYPPETEGFRFRYLNSGVFVGRVHALRECMRGYSFDDAEDDQRFWTTRFLRRPDLVSLDYHNRIFLNCAGVDKADIAYHPGGWVTYGDGATPLLVHANGGDKSYIDPLLRGP